jgi:hypothetical protein
MGSFVGRDATTTHTQSVVAFRQTARQLAQK